MKAASSVTHLINGQRRTGKEKDRITHYTPVLENGRYERDEGLCVLMWSASNRSASYSVWVANGIYLILAILLVYVEIVI